MSINLTSDNSHVCIIDVQGRLAEVVADSALMFKSLGKLIQAANLTEVDVTYVEHCADKLGATHSAILPLLNEASCLHKDTFSVAKSPSFSERFSVSKDKYILVCGTEAHVCVYQSVRNMLDLGFNVIVVADCMSSRTRNDKQLAVNLMQQMGATVMSSEMICFDWIASPSHPSFAEFMKIVK